MTKNTTNLVVSEIRTKWAAYRKTGLAGLKQQVIDRLAVLGVRTEGLVGMSDTQLADYLSENWSA